MGRKNKKAKQAAGRDHTQGTPGEAPADPNVPHEATADEPLPLGADGGHTDDHQATGPVETAGTAGTPEAPMAANPEDAADAADATDPSGEETPVRSDPSFEAATTADDVRTADPSEDPALDADETPGAPVSGTAEEDAPGPLSAAPSDEADLSIAGDASEAAQAVDEFAATRERVADPDDWRLERRDGSMEIETRSQRKKLSPEELEEARRFRALTHAANGTSLALMLTALTTHLAGIGPKGLETWLMVLAVGAYIGAAWMFPRARFEPTLPTGAPEDIARTRQVREVTLRSFGVGFGILFAIIGFLEIMALFVALGLIADLSQSQVTLAKHFLFIPSIALSTLIAATYVRMRMPSSTPPVPHQDKIQAAGLALFALASLVAVFFALGIDAVVAATEVVPRQGIYIATIGILSALAIGNLRLELPDAVRIVLNEVERSKLVDRRSAETMHKKMLRNYVLALVFVVGSIGFLVSKAAGLIDTEKSGGLDVVLLVYLGLGILFLGTVVMHFFQAKQISSRVILPKKGQALGKRRYKPEEVHLFILLGVSGCFALMFIILAALVGTGSLTSVGPFEVTRAHGTDFGVFAILAGIGPFGFHYAREASRIRTIDEKFPDFLRDLAESQRAGMTLPKALITASKGVYGPLTKEIQIMAAQVEWGVSFSEALRRFAERTRTPLIERTVSLVIEASASGGNVVDILAAASDDAREIKNILVERKQQMSVYSMIIYIAFGVFLTVITVLNSQFIPQLAASTSQVAGTSLGGIQFGDIDVPTYQRLFWHAALIQGIGGGLVSGVMTEGHPYSGFRHSFIMTLGAYGIFRFIIM